MQVIYGDESPPALGPTVVTVGVFDGVHRGHQALLAEQRRLADDAGLATAVVLFDRHPATVVDPASAPRLLTSLSHRLGLLGDLGVDLAYILRFDEERSLQEPADFVREILIEMLDAQVELSGEDHHFGHRRRGNVTALAEIAVQHALKVVTVPLLYDAAIAGPVSSTAVRAVAASGDPVLAARLLGRPHEVHGVVEHGDARGRTIGFPTANVAVAGDIILPSDGVYAGWYVGSDGATRPAAINVGRRPTFYDENGLLLVEAHLIDFDGDLYGDRAAVRFTQRLRDEQRFDGIDSLARQLKADVEQARTLLA